MRNANILAMLLLAAMVLSVVDVAQAVVIFGDARANYIAGSLAGDTTASFNSGTGLSDTFGTGRWNYYSSTDVDPSLGTLAYLQYATMAPAFGTIGYNGTGAYGTPTVTNQKLYGATGVPGPNEVSQHPGTTSARASLIRWTAGDGEAAAGTLSVQGTIRRANTNASGDGYNFYVYVNGSLAYQQLVPNTSYGTTYPFDLTGLTIGAGQNVDFLVDRGGTSYTADGAYLAVNLSVVPVVPEPGTLVLLTCGLVGLLCYAWRKRK